MTRSQWISQVVLLLAFFVIPAYAQIASDGPDPLHFTRVYADPEGVSHFSKETMALASVELGADLPTAPASPPLATEGIRFFCFPAGTVVEWHPAPRPQIYLILSGELEMEVGDGEVRRFGSGSVILGEATQGTGVRVIWHGRPRSCVAVSPLVR